MYYYTYNIMPCLIRRTDNTLAYLSKTNECMLGKRTPRPKPKRQISRKEKMIVNNLIEELMIIINLPETNSLRRQSYYREIDKLKTRIS